MSIYQPRIAKEKARGASLRERRRIAEEVRRACIEAAMRALDEAQGQGLPATDAWMRALDAMRVLDLRPVVTESGHPSASSPGGVREGLEIHAPAGIFPPRV